MVVERTLLLAAADRCCNSYRVMVWVSVGLVGRVSHRSGDDDLRHRSVVDVFARRRPPRSAASRVRSHRRGRFATHGPCADSSPPTVKPNRPSLKEAA
jgi:hypothetical protein